MVHEQRTCNECRHSIPISGREEFHIIKCVVMVHDVPDHFARLCKNYDPLPDLKGKDGPEHETQATTDQERKDATHPSQN